MTNNDNHVDDATWFYFMRWYMELRVKTKQKEYPIYFGKGILKQAGEYLEGKSVILIVTDDGVPEVWVKMVHQQFPQATVYTIPQGEESKCFKQYEALLQKLLECNASRSDTVIALGGGVVGDLTGFACSTYMRGISYVNIPTTTLSQIDSSIGGKTAIDFGGAKNIVGSFWQPEAVLVDPEVLTTLSKRHFNNGLAEGVKEGLIKDAELFSLFEQDQYEEHIEEIIGICLQIKKEIVENDERETGERKLLNFGHTFGHAYESYYGFDTYLHGECVAMGMMTILNNEQIKQRLAAVLNRLSLPISCDAPKERIIELVTKDKKMNHDKITIVQVNEIGHGYLETWSLEDIRKKVEQ